MAELVAAVVLTGGRSRRMGQEKALLTLPDGRTCLQAVLETARTVANPVFLGVDTAEHGRRLCAMLPEPLPGIVVDTLPGEGPLTAISAALRAAAPCAVLALAVDAPLVRRSLLALMCSALQEAEGQSPDAVVARVHGKSQPLPAIYTARLADLADKLLLHGRAGPRALLDEPGVRVRWLDDVAIQVVDPDFRSFAEANTPEQWRSMLAFQTA